MRTTAALILLAMVPGCATAPGAEEIRAIFACDRGPNVTVVFAGDSATIETPDGPITLRQAPAASGYHYRSATRSIRGKGRDMHYTIGRMAPMTCREM